VDFSACSSSLSTKRQVLVRGSEMEKAARLARSKSVVGEGRVRGARPVQV
jgi:hypothetical protein